MPSSQLPTTLNGYGGEDWSEYTQLNVLVDDFTEPRALRPRELDPEVNLLPQLSNWQLFRYPRDSLYQDGQPRIWRGLKIDNSNGFNISPKRFIDGDPNTAEVKQNWGPGGSPVWHPRHKTHDEFYTIDVGARIPFDRFVYYPPDGFNTVTDEPYRPNFTVNKFELTATNDLVQMETEEPTRGPIPGGTPLYNDYCNEIFFNTTSGLCHYVPLDVMLHSTGQNFAGVVDLRFPLQYLRVFRFRSMPDENWQGIPGYGIIYRMAYAEFEIYGRGFVPEATWESRVIDMGREVNFGRITFGITALRREVEDGVVTVTSDNYNSRLTTIRIPVSGVIGIVDLIPCNIWRLDGYRRSGEETDEADPDREDVGCGCRQGGHGRADGA